MNDSGQFSGKKVLFDDDDEAEVLLQKNEPPLPAMSNNQIRDLLVDDLNPALDKNLSVKSDQSNSQVSFLIFNQKSLWFKMEIKTFHLRTIFSPHSPPRQARHLFHLCTSPTSSTAPFRYSAMTGRPSRCTTPERRRGGIREIHEW